MEEAIRNKYLKCKYKVKKWESEFKQVSGTIPSKTDIKNAPTHIKEAYRTYWKLKTISLETSLVDISFGDEDTMDSFPLPLSDNAENISGFITQPCDDSVSKDDFQTKEIIDPVKSTRENEDEIPKFTLNIYNSVSRDDSKVLIKPIEQMKQNEDDSSKLSSNVDNYEISGGKSNIQLKDCEDRYNKNSVWGSHLNNVKKLAEKSKSETLPVLSRYTAKLFAGATFKKRNPRKSFIRKEKSCDISMSHIEESQNSIISDGGQMENFSNIDDIKYVKEEKTSFVDEDSQSFELNNSKFKIISNSQSHKISQPVSLLQKSLAVNLSMAQLGNRSVDKGWLERLDKQANVEIVNKVDCSDSGIELTDSSVTSVEPKSSPPSASVLQSDDISDSEDFICDSDSENERTKLFNSFSSITKTNSLGRLSSLSNKAFKRANSSPSSITQLKTEPQISISKKRLIDQIDSELTVSESKKIRINETKPILYNTSCVGLTNNYSHVEELSTAVKSSKDCNLEKLATQVNQLVEIQNKTLKTKEMRQEEILRQKVSSGKANENFVKINIQKKTYVRGKKTMTFQKYKKQKWKNIKKSQGCNENGVYKCFKCGDVGHFAKNCMKACDQLLPVEDLDEEDDSPFPSLQEAEEQALELSKKLCVRRNLNDLPVHVASEVVDGTDIVPLPPPMLCDDLSRIINQEPIFKLNQDGSVIDTPLIVPQTLMQFGHERWRPGQETAVMRVLSGLSTLVTLSTGSGKSLCYQLPAYLYHTLQKRITLVVSPLVSLMEDQVYGVPACMRIACLHTNQSPKVRETVYEQLRANSLHALLLSPESLAIGDRVGELLRSLPPVAFACVDEAHCISQWSHNFRPSYLMVCQVLREKLGVKTILGLTATASQATIASVSTALALPDGVEGVIKDIPIPDNLQLSVSCDKNKDTALIKLLNGPRFSDCRSIIVYCTRRDDCQRLAAYIRTCLQDVSKEDGKVKRGKLSWNAEAYHAGLTAARRKSVQKAFMSGKTRIVVATVAFGMGINKQDIQGIIHYNMPSAFERYVQEVGRAGRDGQTAHCHLFLNTEGKDLSEIRRHIYADSVERHTIRKLLQRVFVPCSCGGACPSHEVAFSVDETVCALDLPEENIATLLCYLELHARQWAHVCSRAYTRCRMLSYKGPKLIRRAARESPPVAVAVALEVQKGVKLDKVNKLEFSIFPVAAAIKWDSGIVKQQLKNLEWTKVNDQPRRSGLTVEFYDLGFRVQAPGNLCGEELDSALDSLTSRVETQESTALKQLQAIFQLLTEVSHKSVDECLDEVDSKRCEKLKTNIRHYFTKDNYLDSYNVPEVALINEEQVVADIHNLVNCYRDVNFSGRAIARIFHGIPSPNYSAQQWGRCRFWRIHLHEDFKLLFKLATRELIKMR